MERLLDVVSAGEVIYLLSYTDLVDGAGAFCDPDFCFIQPVTGQVALPAGFAAVDFPHTGYVIRTNPTHAPPRNRLEAFGNLHGLETIRIVLDSAREDGDIRLKDLWQASGVVPVWQSVGNIAFHDSVSWGNYEPHAGIPKYREVVVYDANGVALRFWGERRANGSWLYRGAQGVFSELKEHPERPGEFHLLGGPPGAMHAAGGWLYIFNLVEPMQGRYSGMGAYLGMLVDPAGNRISISHATYNDPTSTVLGYYPVDYSSLAPLKAISRDWQGNLMYHSSPTSILGFGVAHSGEVRWGEYDFRVSLGNEVYVGKRSERWEVALFDKREALPFTRNFDSFSRHGARLSRQQVGELCPTSYSYAWRDVNGASTASEFTITAQQQGKRPKWLSYTLGQREGEPPRRGFEAAQLLLPSLRDASVYERTLYHFNRDGKIDLVRFFSTRWDDTPQWETSITYHSDNPALISSVTFSDLRANRSFTMLYSWKTAPLTPFSWMGETIERGSEWVLGPCGFALPTRGRGGRRIASHRSRSHSGCSRARDALGVSRRWASEVRAVAWTFDGSAVAS